MLIHLAADVRRLLGAPERVRHEHERARVIACGDVYVGQVGRHARDTLWVVPRPFRHHRAFEGTLGVGEATQVTIVDPELD